VKLQRSWADDSVVDGSLQRWSEETGAGTPLAGLIAQTRSGMVSVGPSWQTADPGLIDGQKWASDPTHQDLGLRCPRRSAECPVANIDLQKTVPGSLASGECQKTRRAATARIDVGQTRQLYVPNSAR